MGQLTLILGGARSGKSSYAEQLAAGDGGQVVYIATAQALDGEMAARVAAHKSKRPQTWMTLEIPSNIGERLESHPVEADVVLLDCLTLLVSNLLMTGADGEPPQEEAAHMIVQEEIDSLVKTIKGHPAHWILVSNEVGMGLVPPYPLGRIYRDQLGWANQRIAAAADQVFLMVAGIPWLLTPPH